MSSKVKHDISQKVYTYNYIVISISFLKSMFMSIFYKFTFTEIMFKQLGYKTTSINLCK